VCLFVCLFVEYNNNNNNKDRYHWFGQFCRCRERGNSRATSAYIYSVEESRGVPVPLFPSGTSSSVVSMPRRLLTRMDRAERAAAPPMSRFVRAVWRRFKELAVSSEPVAPRALFFSSSSLINYRRFNVVGGNADAHVCDR
jgi:hypothetical protein